MLKAGILPQFLCLYKSLFKFLDIIPYSSVNPGSQFQPLTGCKWRYRLGVTFCELTNPLLVLGLSRVCISITRFFRRCREGSAVGGGLSAYFLAVAQEILWDFAIWLIDNPSTSRCSLIQSIRATDSIPFIPPEVVFKRFNLGCYAVVPAFYTIKF